VLWLWLLLTRFEGPASAGHVLGVFPERFDARAEDVYGVARFDGRPGNVVEDFVEFANVGDRGGEGG